MKTTAQVSPEKLRGGFYTPPSLVAFCLNRLEPLLPSCEKLRVLEPSVGDGAFMRGLASSELRHRLMEIVGVEPVETEVRRARRALRDTGLAGEIIATSVLKWAVHTTGRYHAAIGNPPFVRFQFVSARDRIDTGRLGEQLGIAFKGVSNLWLPVLLAALGRLEEEGAFAFVIPAECFTGSAARIVRSWLLSNTVDLRFDIFPAGSFPKVLQEVMVMSGRRKRTEPARARLTITEHDPAGASRSWSHSPASAHNWTRLLLQPPYLEALESASASGLVAPLGSVATFEVSIVTGANEFFSTDTHTRDLYDLRHWARPLLPRIRHAPGLSYTSEDHELAEAAGARTWLLDFSEHAPDPACARGPRRYLEQGIEKGLNKRYKCRIRSPWYRVPGIRAGELLLSKRSHLFPRVILNELGVLTTDTIYRGRVSDTRVLSAQGLVGAFHNSLTLLSAELEGRSFGGGVLELVPSEIARLLLPIWPAASGHLRELDRCARGASPEGLIARTDAALVRAKLLAPDLLETLAEARRLLMDRRLLRNRVDRMAPSAEETELRLAA